MFKIRDGRLCFFQWDLDRQLIIEDSTIKEVHFCNRTSDCSLVCETFVEDGLTLVNVPNILLQTSWRIHIYAYDGLYTKHEECFEVTARTKPNDYIYTETEVKRWEDLEKQIEEALNEETINAAVREYLDTHEVPTGATEAQAAQIEQNKKDIEELKNKEVDLTGYATEDYVDEAVGKVEIPVIPTKVSAFENDAGYLTEHQDLSDYAKKTDIPSVEGLATEKYVDDAIAAIDVSTGGDKNEVHIGSDAPTDADVEIWIDPDATPSVEYALKSDIPDVSGFTTMAAVEGKGYQTEAQVNTLINAALGVIENGTY